MATYTVDKIEYNSNVYVLQDSGALQLTGGQVTGPVTFGDSISVDEATMGDLVVNGNASFTNNIQANTINGVAVGSSPKFTDTNTEVSTLTLASGSTAGTVLAYGGKYTLTAGSKTVSFTMPSTDNTNTTYTFANGTNGFTVTPSGGTAQTVTVTPSIINNVTGSGTSGYLAKFNGANTITSGPQLGSGTTTFLRNDGSWATPVGTTYSVVSKTANGLAPQLPNETTTTKFLRQDGSWAVPAYISNTDEKLKTVALTSATTYYPILATGANAAANRQVDSTLGGLKYISTAGTTSAVGTAILQLGNATASGTANNEQGVVRLYGPGATYYVDLKATTIASSNKTITIPNATGTIALTGSTTSSSTTGLSIADHGTTSVGSASGWSAGTASSWAFEEVSIPNVTAAGSASSWTFEEKSIPNVTSAGSASTWAFTGVTVANSISGAVDSTDSTQLNITLGTTTVQSKSSGGNGTAPTLGTAIKVQSKSGGSNGSAPTLGTAIKVQSKKSGSNSTVPSLTITSTTVVNGKTHSITDSGHTHTNG